ncbi:matrix metallopeptidase 23bb isoform X3 [Syngnathus typhle]|uniref:matrix metallopeptidase 23bb isoform X3 n=1 Tax=Syngnathus typhle TaxID=161592 RepID=UPI002A6B4CE6|nr:matrix metallopeptidase 23bb isoform X3 [Syngnathus typhle]
MEIPPLLVALMVTSQVFADTSASSSGHRVSKRYTINPLGYKWTHANITYRLESFPDTLSADATRQGLSSAFSKWSDVSPLSFTEVRQRDADITIGFYALNHSDCASSPLHPCFDGINGELAHAFLPPRGEIHFDKHEFWIIGRSRFSWSRGVWLNDLVQVAAHEIGHVLGLWHSAHPHALMNPNATTTGQRDVGPDDVRAIRRLYGCVDKRRACERWAGSGLCQRRKRLMLRTCPRRCRLCSEAPEAMTTPPPPANVRVKVVSRGKVVGFRCGTKNLPWPAPKVRSAQPHALSGGEPLKQAGCPGERGARWSWYKDGERIAASVPGHIALKGRDLRIVANEFNEGVYTCHLHGRGRASAANSWSVRLRKPAGWPQLTRSQSAST